MKDSNKELTDKPTTTVAYESSSIFRFGNLYTYVMETCVAVRILNQNYLYGHCFKKLNLDQI
jgi:hypothetical protein